MEYDNADREEGLWRSMVAGTLGGLVASLAMNQFQAAVSAVSESMERQERQRRMQRPKPPEQPEQQGDDATVKAAQAISTATLEHDLSDDEKKWAGPAVHYGLGAALGAVYGAFAIATPIQTASGMGYGAAVWLGADEIAVPLLGLSEPPYKTPVSGHVIALASHLVFGLVTHFTRKLALS